MRRGGRRIVLGSSRRRGGRRGRGFFGGRRLGGVRGGIGRIPTVSEVPFTIDDTDRLRSEEPEKTARKVETAVGASRALIRNGGNSGLSVVSHTDLLEAVGTGVSATELLNGQGQATAVTLGMGKAHTALFKATIKSLSTLYIPQAPL